MEIIHPSGECYDLPSSLVLEITRTNPFFSEIGEQSLPVSLPLSSKNKRLLGFPNRFDSRNKIIKELDVIIKTGLFQTKARQVILSVNAGIIDTVFYFGTGEFYTKIKNISLSEVTEKYNMPFSYWEMERIAIGTADICNMLAVFPAIANDNLNQGEYRILNQYDASYMSLESWNGLIPFYNKLARQEIMKEGDSEILISIPKSYYMTPFIRLKWLLKVVFSHVGYTLNDNLFFSDPDLSKLVIMNNTADAIICNKLIISDLLPSGTISDFLNILRERFRCEFIINTDSTADVVFFKDLISKQIDYNLSDTVTSHPSITFSTPKRLSLLQNYTADDNSKITLSALLADLEYIKVIDDGSTPGVSYLYSYLDSSKGFIQKRYLKGHQTVKVNYNLDNVVNDLDSEISEIEELALKDKIPAIIKSMPFVGDMRSLYSSLKIDDNTEDDSTSTFKESNTEWILCFDLGRQNVYVGGQKTAYNTKGNTETNNASLKLFASKGIYNIYHKDYDKLLRNSLNSVEYSHMLSEQLKYNLNQDAIALINNNVVLLESAKFDIGEKNSKEVAWRTLRIDSPESVIVGHKEAITEPGYYWVRHVEWSHRPDANHTWYFIDGEPASTFYKPPTEQDYDASGYRLHEQTYNCQEKFMSTLTKQFTIKTWLTAEKFT